MRLVLLVLLLVASGPSASAQVLEPAEGEVVEEVELEPVASEPPATPATAPRPVPDGAPLASPDQIRALLPDRIGAFVFDELFVPEGFSGRPGEPSVSPNVIYEDDRGRSLFVVVEQHRDPAAAQQRREDLESRARTGGTRDTLLQGRPAYLVGDGTRVDLPIGEGISVSGYFSGGGSGTRAEVVRALESLDLGGLVALDRAYVRALDLAAVDAFDRDQADGAAPDDPAAVAKAALPLRALAEALPEQVGGFALARLSAAPYAGRDGGADDRGRTVEARYRAASGEEVVLALSHFRNEAALSDLSRAWWAGGAMMGDAVETTLGGAPAYTREGPPAVAAFVGETIEVSARPAAEGVPLDALRGVVEAVDVDRLTVLDHAYREALAEATTLEGARTDALAGGVPDVDCDSYNDGVRARARDLVGAGQLVPWIVFLTEAEAASGTTSDGGAIGMLTDEAVLTFPQEGNAWLACVSEGNLLWSPEGAHAFLGRVTGLWDRPEAASVRVEPGALTDVVFRGRVEADGPNDTP